MDSSSNPPVANVIRAGPTRAGGWGINAGWSGPRETSHGRQESHQEASRPHVSFKKAQLPPVHPPPPLVRLSPTNAPPSTVLSRMFIASMGKTFDSGTAGPGRPPHSQPVAQAVGDTTSHRGQRRSERTDTVASQRADGHGGVAASGRTRWRRSERTDTVAAAAASSRAAC
ncbi:unnamed protein product [Arctogadus glacialis]